MLDTVRRFWQERTMQPRGLRQKPQRSPDDDQSPAAHPRAPREFAFTSVDVGNYA
jgi:hypothetical protein